MFISSLRTRGFRDLSAFEATNLERIVTVSGSPPAVTALGDALELALGIFDPGRLERLFRRWRLGDSLEFLSDGFVVEQASWSDGGHLRTLLGDGRTVRVDLTLEPDPPLFRRLREQAAREPRLAPALAGGGVLHLSVGALFARSLDAVALSVDRFSLGDVVLSTSESQRWVSKVLSSLGSRFHRHDPAEPLGPLALDALTSFDRHDRYGQWASALEPEGPSLRVVQGPGEAPLVLADERLLDRWGPRTQHAAAVAASVYLSGAEIIWAESEESLLRRGVEGPGSPLEQVFVVQAGGALRVEDQRAPLPRTAPIPTTLTTAPRNDEEPSQT